MLKINNLEEATLFKELSAQESSLYSGGNLGKFVLDPHLTIGCPGNGRPVRKRYPNGTTGSICVYDEPLLPLPEPPPFS